MHLIQYNHFLRVLSIASIAGICVYLLTCIYYSGNGLQSLVTLVQNANLKNYCYNDFTSGLKKGSVTDTEDLHQVHDIIKTSTGCYDKALEPRIQRRGNYWVLYNYMPAESSFGCAESVTYTTHGDFTFLDNVEPLVDKWQGPVSLALYAPGEDFAQTVESISYLKYCGNKLVRQYVTFHIYFQDQFMPKPTPKINSSHDCSQLPPYLKISPEQTFKAKNELVYPVNVGRNIARETAQTHFILPSDIELYPSPNIIRQFLIMVANDTGLSGNFENPKVFPLHLFEVEADKTVASSKTELKEMLKQGTAVPFHKYVCSYCHTIPKSKEWLDAEETEGLHVFNVGKRQGAFANWEPIFIGTNSEPFYDERLTWEGRRDKMTQGYALCVLDYQFLILDNAFLVHRPGIKRYSKAKEKDSRIRLTQETNILIDQQIYPELKVVYGEKPGCVV